MAAQEIKKEGELFFNKKSLFSIWGDKWPRRYFRLTSNSFSRSLDKMDVNITETISLRFATVRNLGAVDAKGKTAPAGCEPRYLFEVEDMRKQLVFRLSSTKRDCEEWIAAIEAQHLECQAVSQSD